MDKQRSTKHTHKTKDRVTRTPLKTLVSLAFMQRIQVNCFHYYNIYVHASLTILTIHCHRNKNCPIMNAGFMWGNTIGHVENNKRFIEYWMVLSCRKLYMDFCKNVDEL